MLNYYEGMESDDYEDYEITWEDVDDIQFKGKTLYFKQKIPYLYLFL